MFNTMVGIPIFIVADSIPNSFPLFFPQVYTFPVKFYIKLIIL